MSQGDMYSAMESKKQREEKGKVEEEKGENGEKYAH